MAVVEGIGRCLKYKRADDLWRLDRYLAEPREGESGPPLEKAALPYDEATLGSHAKTLQRGFLSATVALRKIVDSPGSKERATDDAIAAFDRQSEAMIKFSGKRRLFLFLAPDGGFRLERHIARLRAFVDNERITLHGIVSTGATGCDDFRGLCLASDGGSFAELETSQVADEVERIYAQSINRFDVVYTARDGVGTAEASIRITSPSGCGRATFTAPGA
jgi:hypothetical protein